MIIWLFDKTAPEDSMKLKKDLRNQFIWNNEQIIW